MKKFNPDNLDKNFIANIEKLSAALGIDPAVYIENTLIKRLALEQAANDVYGNNSAIFPEFISYDGEIKRGHELYKILYNLERERLEREYVENLAAVPWEVCSDKEKELLIKYKLDPASKAEKKAVEADIKKLQESGEIGEVETTWNNKKS